MGIVNYVNLVRRETTNMPTKFTTSSHVKVTRGNSEAVSEKVGVQVESRNGPLNCIQTN
jgi:hypothetical protein